MDFSRHLLWVPLAHEISGSCLRKASSHVVAAIFPTAFVPFHEALTEVGGVQVSSARVRGGEYLYGKWEPQLLH